MRTTLTIEPAVAQEIRTRMAERGTSVPGWQPDAGGVDFYACFFEELASGGIGQFLAGVDAAAR